MTAKEFLEIKAMFNANKKVSGFIHDGLSELLNEYEDAIAKLLEHVEKTIQSTKGNHEQTKNP